MEHSRLLTLFIIFLAVQNLTSQKISGTVTDEENGNPIPYATIILKDTEGEFLEGTTSDERGIYSLQYKEGNYWVEISFMGYAQQKTEVVINGDIVKNFVLAAEVSELSEVTVIGEVTTVQQMIDKKVINVGKDLSSGGGDATTVLQQLAEVQADQDGNITLRGSQNVNVLLNGKPSPLSTTELLRQISANEISKIEIITSPSAKYQANGLTGIVNIITKKKVKKGFSLNTNAAINTLGGYNGGANLAYGRTKINYRIGASYRKSAFKNENDQERFGTQPFEQRGNFDFDGDVYNVNGGVDWFPSEKDEFSVGMNYTDNGHTLENRADILQDNLRTDQRTVGQHSHKTLNINGNYRHIFKNEEDYLEFDAQFSNNTNLLEGNFIPNLAVLDNSTDNDALILTAAFDYSGTLSDKWKLESGLFWNQQQLKNSRSFFDAQGALSATEAFENVQSTAAMYSLLKYGTEKFNLQMGLRGELFRRKAFLITDGAEIESDFENLFPSVHLSYPINESQTFILGYNRRTSRPSLYQVNPISFQVNEFSINQGNPSLEPEFSNNFETSYQIKKKFLSVIPTLSYRLKNNIILNTNFLNESGVTVHSYVNNGKSDAYGLELAINIKPVKWMTNDLNFNWNYEEFKEDLIGFESNFSRFFTFTSRNNITLSKKTKATVTWKYNAPSRGFYFTNVTRQNLDIALRQQVFNGKGNINIRLTDIFDTLEYRGSNSGLGFRQDFRYKPASRVAHLAFTYNLDQGSLKKRNKKSRQYKSGIID